MYCAPKYGRFGFFLVQEISKQFPEIKVKTCHGRKKNLMSVGWEMYTQVKIENPRFFHSLVEYSGCEVPGVCRVPQCSSVSRCLGQQIRAHNT